MNHHSPALSENAVTTKIWDNSKWRPSSKTALSIAIPTYRDDPTDLLDGLNGCDEIERVEIIVYDDGSKRPDLINNMIEQGELMRCAVRIVSAADNMGRAVARNALLHHARADWVLLLDADMSPDENDFIAKYLDQIADVDEPSLIVGGFSLRDAPTDKKYALHRWQAARSECLSAHERQKDPGRFVFTSNVVCHKDIFDRFHFDEEFAGWGWEDVDWGLRVAQSAPVMHIDNAATHMGLDTVNDLMSKYGASGQNFNLILQKHPDTIARTPLAKAAFKLKRVPFKPMLKRMCQFVISETDWMPTTVKGIALKIWRALVYAEAIND